MSLVDDFLESGGSYLKNETVESAVILVCLALILGFGAVVAPFFSSFIRFVGSRMKGRREGFRWCMGLSGICFALSGFCGAAAVLQLNAFVHEQRYHDTFFHIEEGPVLLLIVGAVAIIVSVIQRRKDVRLRSAK